MRLSQKYRETILKSFSDVFQDGEVFLFGSRVDDNTKGGDIDLYLKVFDKRELFRKKIKFLARVKRELGDQKIDIVFDIDNTRLIEKEAIRWGVKL